MVGWLGVGFFTGFRSFSCVCAPKRAQYTKQLNQAQYDIRAGSNTQNKLKCFDFSFACICENKDP